MSTAQRLSITAPIMGLNFETTPHDSVNLSCDLYIAEITTFTVMTFSLYQLV
jgi:hypothetical protein